MTLTVEMAKANLQVLEEAGKVSEGKVVAWQGRELSLITPENTDPATRSFIDFGVRIGFGYSCDAETNGKIKAESEKVLREATRLVPEKEPAREPSLAEVLAEVKELKQQVAEFTKLKSEGKDAILAKLDKQQPLKAEDLAPILEAVKQNAQAARSGMEQIQQAVAAKEPKARRMVSKQKDEKASSVPDKEEAESASRSRRRRRHASESTSSTADTRSPVSSPRKDDVE